MVNFSVDDYKVAAVEHPRELLHMPYLALQDLLKYLTCRLGVCGTLQVGSAGAKAQLMPYRPDEIQELTLGVDIRELTTYLGSCNASFDPNSAISTILGHKASQAMGDALKTTPTALEVLSLIAKSIGEDLSYAIFHGRRNPKGTKTADLFDGFFTIIEKEADANNITEAKGNLVISKKITSVNACDVLKALRSQVDPKLRAQKCNVYCSPEVYDAYTEAYAQSHGGLVYAKEYDQEFIEGTRKKWKLVPLDQMAGSPLMIITPQENMLVGLDQMSDAERVNVEKYAPDTITLEMRLFFGVQFESIAKERFCVVAISDATDLPLNDEDYDNDDTND